MTQLMTPLENKLMRIIKSLQHLKTHNYQLIMSVNNTISKHQVPLAQVLVKVLSARKL